MSATGNPSAEITAVPNSIMGRIFLIWIIPLVMASCRILITTCSSSTRLWTIGHRRALPPPEVPHML
jgi:hypothetical protein